MLAKTSRTELLHKLEQKVGHPIKEEDLSMETRQAVKDLVEVQRRVSVILEVLEGEKGRVENSAVLSFTSKIHKDKEIEAHSGEIAKLQKEIDDKVSELSTQIIQEENARRMGQPTPVREKGEAVQLKCPTCGAALPMPTGRFVKCEYCKSTLSIQDVGPQIATMIQRI